jgi:hypothetical protein
MGTRSVPRRPEEITPSWLSEALTGCGVANGARIVSVKAQSIGAGAGLFGQLARLHVTYDGGSNGAPRTLIAKMPTTHPGNREIGNLFQFYEREARFYEEVAPGLEIRVPVCYFGVMDVAADDHVLLMEDLATGATPGDEVAGCTLKQAETAIEALARHHAPWWDHPRLDDLDWMPLVNAPVHQSAQQSYQEAWGPYCELFGGDLTPYQLAAGERMRDKVIDLLNHYEPAPRTIMHGDYRLDNLFFDHEDGSSVAAIDWQISSRGRGVFDVAYFIASSLEPDVRKAHELRLLRLWHDIIVDGGAKGYSLDEALYDYRKAVLYCNVYTVIGVGSMDAANERGLALQKAWIRRRGAAMEDLDCAEVMPA